MTIGGTIRVVTFIFSPALTEGVAFCAEASGIMPGMAIAMTSHMYRKTKTASFGKEFTVITSQFGFGRLAVYNISTAKPMLQSEDVCMTICQDPGISAGDAGTADIRPCLQKAGGWPDVALDPATRGCIVEARSISKA